MRDVLDRLRDALHDTEHDLQRAIQHERCAELRTRAATLREAVREIEHLRDEVRAPNSSPLNAADLYGP